MLFSQHCLDFSVAMLSGGSRTTLYMVFTCMVLSSNIKTTLNRIFPSALLSGAPQTTVNMVFICSLSSQVCLLGQHGTGKLIM